ncbi:MAG: hypothetical protein ACI31V_01690 [Bacilli bacterium]
MGIDYYINNISDDKLIGGGFEKKCYDFGDFVLLESRYLNGNQIDNEKSKVINIKNILDRLNINSYKIFDYRVVSDKIYVLENKVKGGPLQDTRVGIDSNIYINRLKELDNFDILKKFVSDYLSIIDSGLSIDPSNPNNFLFDGSSIHFIDLGLFNNVDKKFVCFYIMHNIINTYCDINDIEDVDIISFYINDIYSKVCSIYVELGYNDSMYSFSPNGLISEYIDRKISKFRKNCVNERTKSI